MNKEEQSAIYEQGSMLSVAASEVQASKQLEEELRKEKDRLRRKQYYEANKAKHRDYYREYQRRKRAEERERRANMSEEEKAALEGEKLKKQHARSLKNIQKLQEKIDALQKRGE